MTRLTRTQIVIFFLAAAVVVLGYRVLSLQSQRREDEHKEIVRDRVQAAETGTDQHLQKFSLKGFDDKGKVFWNLEGETAKIEPGQAIYLEQNVTFRLEDGTVVRTDHVQWSPDSGTLKTAAPVFVEHQNVRVRGTGSVGKPKENFVQLNRDIEMIINEKTKLTCKGPMKIFYKQNKMTFYRHVKIVDERGTLSSNRMDVMFDPVGKRIKEVIAAGDVVIERGADRTRSQRAIYTVATGAVRLEGNPEITLHKNSSAMIDGAFRN